MGTCGECCDTCEYIIRHSKLGESYGTTTSVEKTEHNAFTE
jgi:hypothetical protein